MGQPTGQDTDQEQLRRIVVYGHPPLRRIAAPVTALGDALRALVGQLFATMYEAPGIGLAGPQINELQRVFVVDPSYADRGGARLAMVNPEILESSGLETFEEGCLSVPGVFADIKRPEKILVLYFDGQGKQHEEEFDDIMARVIQHENDHLDGKLFVDQLSPMRRTLLRKRLREIEAES